MDFRMGKLHGHQHSGTRRTVNQLGALSESRICAEADHTLQTFLGSVLCRDAAVLVRGGCRPFVIVKSCTRCRRMESYFCNLSR